MCVCVFVCFAGCYCLYTVYYTVYIFCVGLRGTESENTDTVVVFSLAVKVSQIRGSDVAAQLLTVGVSRCLKSLQMFHTCQYYCSGGVAIDGLARLLLALRCTMISGGLVGCF